MKRNALVWTMIFSVCFGGINVAQAGWKGPRIPTKPSDLDPGKAIREAAERAAEALRIKEAADALAKAEADIRAEADRAAANAKAEKERAAAALAKAEADAREALRIKEAADALAKAEADIRAEAERIKAEAARKDAERLEAQRKAEADIKAEAARLKEKAGKKAAAVFSDLQKKFPKVPTKLLSVDNGTMTKHGDDDGDPNSGSSGGGGTWDWSRLWHHWMRSLKLEKREETDEEKFEREDRIAQRKQERKEQKEGKKEEPQVAKVEPKAPVEPVCPKPETKLEKNGLVDKSQPTISVDQKVEQVQTQTQVPYYVRFKAGVLGYSLSIKMNANGNVEDVVLGYPNGVSVSNGNIDWSRSTDAQWGPFVGSFAAGLSSATICGGTGIAPLIAIVALQGCYEFKWTPEAN